MKEIKIVSILILAFFFTVLLPPAPVLAQENDPNLIYIRVDGDVEGTNLISRDENLYTFTTNITGSIIFEKDHVILDGNGFVLHADSDAFTINGRNNITIQNLTVITLGTGIMFNQASDCKVLNVLIKAERAGIRARNLTYSQFSNSQIEAKIEYALSLSFSPNNLIINNNLISNMIDAVNCGWSSNNIISGNNITYYTSEFPLANGIHFDGSTNCTIFSNNIFGFPWSGINLQGYSDNNLIEANCVMNCSRGIRISSNENNLTANYIVNNNETGITLESASNSLLINNYLSNNSQNLAISSYTPAGWINNVDSSNTVEGKPVIYWINAVGKTVPSTAGYIALVNCTDITVANHHFTYQGDCILLVYTVNSTITENRLSYNSTIHLHSSSNNRITENIFTNNDCGLFFGSSCVNNLIANNNFTGNNYSFSLSESSNNIITYNNFTKNQNALYFSNANNNNIYLNNFENNTRPVGDIGLNNPPFSITTAVLNHQSTDLITQPLTAVTIEPINFIGPLPLSANIWDNGNKGNFWSDYIGADVDGDGIGDTSYVIYGNNADNYPLIRPVTTSPTITPTPVPPFSSLPTSTVIPNPSSTSSPTPTSTPMPSSPFSQNSPTLPIDNTSFFFDTLHLLFVIIIATILSILLSIALLTIRKRQ